MRSWPSDLRAWLLEFFVLGSLIHIYLYIYIYYIRVYNCRLRVLNCTLYIQLSLEEDLKLGIYISSTIWKSLHWKWYDYALSLIVPFRNLTINSTCHYCICICFNFQSQNLSTQINEERDINARNKQEKQYITGTVSTNTKNICRDYGIIQNIVGAENII